MAYSDEANAPFRITGFTHGSASFLGQVRMLFEKIVTDEPMAADANNFPVSRPVDFVDSRITTDFLNLAAPLAETTTKADVTTTLSEAGGSSGSLLMGKMLPRSVRGGIMRRNGGNPTSQDFHQVGALTMTPTI